MNALLELLSHTYPLHLLPPSYIPLSSPPPLHYISYPGYMPGSVHEFAYPPAPLPPILSSQNETAYVPPQSANELSTSDPNLVLPAISSPPDYPPPVDPAYPSSSINDPGPNVAKEGTATHASIPVSTSPIAVHSLSTFAHGQLPSTYDVGASNVIGYNGTFAGPCLSPEQLSCPITAQKIPKEFHDFYCKSQFGKLFIITDALVVPSYISVAVEVQWKIIIGLKRLDGQTSFIVAVGIDFKIPWQDKKDEESLRLFNLSVTVTRKKAMERRHRNNPGYGILVSQQPITSLNAIQLAHKYSYFPLTEALLPLPYCYQREKAKAFHSSTRLKAVKQQNKDNPLNYVSCPLKITCSPWTTVENTYYHVSCKAEHVVLIEVLETSAGPIVAPDLEIMEYLGDKKQPYIVLNVESTKGCKYAKVKVLKDLSPEPMTMEGNLFTIIASADCNNGLFKMEAVGIHPGTTHISLCSSNPAVFMPNEVDSSPGHVSLKNYDPLPDKSAIVDEYPPSDKPRMMEEKPADPIKKSQFNLKLVAKDTLMIHVLCVRTSTVFHQKFTVIPNCNLNPTHPQRQESQHPGNNRKVNVTQENFVYETIYCKDMKK
ncbi:hypothetical protein CEXT_806281 [Caerostris extrusa]|uniref:Uncharacterized protein n=1 Tax=Caerostris extrusa TaxID=172846 RepID=A0AAV4MW22_CAEEX|nr:hypothetical protein CEXT_806281 [Caerostris extrusa]